MGGGMTEPRGACPRCGAPLHPGAAFCPHCAQSVNARPPRRAPVPLRGKLIRAGLPVAILLAALLAAWLLTRPRVYDAGTAAEVFYRDGDGRYQIVAGWLNQRYEGAPQLRQVVEPEGSFTFPQCLFINQADTGEPADAAFLEKAASITAEFPPDTPSGMSATLELSSQYVPDAAATAFLHFTGRADSQELLWTVSMANGDVIYLRQTVSVSLIQAYDYFPGDAPMNTMGELQALVDEIIARVDPTAAVRIHLPAVTYEGALQIQGRAVGLYGSDSGDARTVFTGGILMTDEEEGGGRLVQVRDIDFLGRGGVGLSAAARVELSGCRFQGWDTAVLAQGEAYVSLRDSQFTDNGVAFHFNSAHYLAGSSDFGGNVFRDNGTALLLDTVPARYALDFDGCLFEGNDVDIDNPCAFPIDISRAVFQ